MFPRTDEDALSMLGFETAAKSPGYRPDEACEDDSNLEIEGEAGMGI